MRPNTAQAAEGPSCGPSIIAPCGVRERLICLVNWSKLISLSINLTPPLPPMAGMRILKPLLFRLVRTVMPAPQPIRHTSAEGS
ncbi:hypothetical protein AOLI_G00157730 [Acnodon oligacanthus]